MTEWKQRELEFRGYIKKELFGKLQSTRGWKYKKEQINIINGIVCIDNFHLEFKIERDYTQRVQYTGLKDINGKKCFEADIVKFQGAEYQMPQNFIGVGVVMFEAGRFLIYHPDKGKLEISFLQEKDMEILGNVFQNPELVEKYGLEIE